MVHRLIVTAAIALTLSVVGLVRSSTPVCAEGGSASAGAAVRVVAGSLRLQSAPAVLDSASGNLATGSFVVTNPGQAAAWFLVVDDRRLAWAPAGAGAGQFPVEGEIPVTTGTGVVASLTSGP